MERVNEKAAVFISFSRVRHFYIVVRTFPKQREEQAPAVPKM